MVCKHILLITFLNKLKLLLFDCLSLCVHIQINVYEEERETDRDTDWERERDKRLCSHMKERLSELNYY